MSDDVHPETNYYKIFAILVIAFAASLGLGYLSPTPAVIALIFAIAAVKAYLVLTYFIHLNAEPRFIKILVGSLIAVLVILYIGLMPDIVWVHGKQVVP